MPTQIGLLDQLVKENILDSKLAQELKITSLNLNKSLDQLLLERNLVTEEQLSRAKASSLGVPFVSVATRGIAPDIISLIPEVVATRYQVIPFDLDRTKNELMVAMVDPTNLEIIEFLKRKSGKAIKPYMGLPSDIALAIADQYSQNLTHDVSEAIKDTTPTQVRTFDANRLGEVIREAPIAKIVSTILEYAIRSRASDVHIEPMETKTRIRYRIDGILHEKLVLPRSVHDAVVSRIKILSNMKIDEKRVPQDGRFNFKFGHDEVDLRISTLPTVYGEKIVMRLLKKSGGIPTLNQLGLRGMALQNLENSILRPHGIILVTGPTGSGKTTTLYAILSKLNTIKVNIMTLEDPVEYEIAGINQVQINPLAGLVFATGMRAFLRQDPNIILVGEVRDNETTQLAIQAALTGHLVFSTLHTNNAATAIPRLLDLKAEPFLIASTLTCIVGQRIVRQICPHCKEEFQPTPQVIGGIKNALGKLFPQGQFSLYKGKGCGECNFTGYFDRLGIFEVLPISSKIAHMVLERATADDVEQQAVAEGMITMKQDGYLKVTQGITTIEEVLRVAQD